MQGHHGPEKRIKTSFSSTDQQLFRDFRRIKAKGEKRKLDSAEVSIQQAGKSILVSGLSDDTTHDAIQLHFESGKSSGGPVRRVQFVAKRDMERVLATHEGEPHVLNQGELSIGIYPEFLESEKVGVRDDWGGLVTTAGGADKAHVSQQSAAKTQQLNIAVDPDVMEFVTTTAFHDELNNSLAAKRSEITWKPNNKMAVIVYRGGHDSDSWHSERIDEVQNYLGKFAKRDVQVNKDFWGAVVAQLSSIPACLGEDPLLVKTIDQAFVVRLVSLSTDVEDYEKKLRFKLEEIYREETRKTLRVYVPKERLILLKKIKFVEKLQEKNKKLKIKPDTEGEGIYFEGSERHINEATEMLQKQISDMVEKKLTLSVSNLKVLDSEEGLMKVKCELESNNVEAVFVIDKDTRVVGTSAAHADSAAWLVKKLLESDSIREEQFICSSPIVRGYLYECRQEDLRSIESQLKYFKVKINKGKGNDDFDISGNKEGLIRARRKLDCLMKDTTSETFDVKQPGLRKFFDSGKGDRLVKSVEKDHNCAIQVQKNFGQRWDDLRSLDSASSGSGDDDSDVDDDEDVTAVSGSDVFTLVMTHGQHKISWRPGNIETEKADVLVSSVGASSKAMVNVDVLAMANPNVGDITVNSGLPLTKHVIHTNCSQWQGGQGEVTLQAIVQKCLLKGEQLGARSIAFPVIGTGNLNFPRHAASRIMLEETISFCQANPVSKVQDIRFIVFQQDQTLTVAFKQEIDRLITKHKLSPVYPKSGLINKIQSRFKRLRVSRGGVCRETTNSYPWANDTDDIVHICVLGKKTGVEKAVESLKKGFSEACTTQNVTNEAISQLSRKQIDSLRRKAEDRDVKLEVEADANCIVVQGQPTEVSAMIGEIWKEISERTKKTQENEQAQLVSRNIEWSCEMRGTSMAFGRKANAKIEMACSKDEPRVHVSLRGEQFVIDLKAKTGRGQRTGEQITLKRKVKGAEEGIPLPEHWDPMPSNNMTVHTVELSPSSFEYQAVLLRFQATVDGVTILKIERIQNPHLYQCYTVRKQKMDKDIGGNSERQLFHGTDAKNVSHINTQGFNRSLCGAHGVKYGRGVYFARDARCSLGYARGGVGARHMYLTRVLVGQYCVGHSSMMVPPPKNTWRPEILYESVVDNQGNPSSFVVFCDNQCYPEYLITMQQ